jgi:hypothetical protein
LIESTEKSSRDVRRAQLQVLSQTPRKIFILRRLRYYDETQYASSRFASQYKGEGPSVHAKKAARGRRAAIPPSRRRDDRQLLYEVCAHGMRRRVDVRVGLPTAAAGGGCGRRRGGGSGRSRGGGCAGA